MDWELMRVKKTKGYKQQKARQSENMERIVLKARCSGCSCRLIKEQFWMLKSQARLLQPAIQAFYNEDHKCDACN